MSGHNKWSSIKHKKGAADAKRGKMFTKLIKEISIASREGGGDPDGNPRLRTAIANAKAVNMPNDNIARAIKKGTGEIEGAAYEEILYEGYGPSGVAIMLEILTDNKNRTVSEVRSIFGKANGSLASSGSVAWMFAKKGKILVEVAAVDEDTLMEIAIEAGAEDVIKEGDTFEIYTIPSDLDNVRTVLENKKIPMTNAERIMIPSTTVKLKGKDAESILRLMERLEEHDDVQNVFANFDIEDDEMDRIMS